MCPWVHDSSLDWLHRGPVLLVLTLNTFFLVHVMLVLVKKLRPTHAQEVQPKLRLGLRALRSLLVLMPLLGTPHVLLLLAPSHGTLAVVFAYARAIVLSTQGLVVTIIYCFLNSEVQESIGNHVERWKSTRDVPLTSTGGAHPLKNLNSQANNAAGDSTRVLETTLGATEGADSNGSSSVDDHQGGGTQGEVHRADCGLLPVFPPLFPVTPNSSPFRRQEVMKPLTRGSCSGSLLLGSTQVTRLLTMGSSTTKCSTATSCTATSALRAQRMMRQTTISNSEDLEATRVQVLPSCFKCSSYPQLTDSQLQMLTREGSLSGRHK
ncbi:calcitonin gene-related peptide type 1 receptor-like isoform X2 [Eriocheir sinensis]|nr:calcitonin gene-related peptide type 1 receptor-like isoform X2 [Eriocheir sinensis]